MVNNALQALAPDAPDAAAEAVDAQVALALPDPSEAPIQALIEPPVARVVELPLEIDADAGTTAEEVAETELDPLAGTRDTDITTAPTAETVATPLAGMAIDPPIVAPRADTDALPLAEAVVVVSADTVDETEDVPEAATKEVATTEVAVVLAVEEPDEVAVAAWVDLALADTVATPCAGTALAATMAVDATATPRPRVTSPP